MKHFAPLGLGIIIASFFIWLIAGQIKFSELTNILSHTRPVWLILALGAFSIGYLCRIVRWHKMLLPNNPGLAWKKCAGPLLASFAVNNLLPFRTGDIMRAFAFNHHMGTHSGNVLATLFVERLLDLLMILAILSITLVIFKLDLNHFSSVGSIMLASVTLCIIFLLLFPALFNPLAQATGKLIIKILPTFGNKIATEINKSMDTLMLLAKKSTMLKLILWSTLIWTAEGGVFWCAAMALPDIIVPSASWLALPVGTLSTLIPGTPGHVGTFDYFTLKAMTTLGNTTSTSTAYALLVHILLWIPPTLTGGLYLLVFHLQKLRLKNSYDKQ